ncbi:hypothetical protein [Streptomyces asiaticus]|uniref:hypothetical protein n=1 Tax=Streptomyces asiaticus TaxID=114695 RepID=UPI003823DC86
MRTRRQPVACGQRRLIFTLTGDGGLVDAVDGPLRSPWPDEMKGAQPMGGLRAAMWLLIAVEVPVYLVWLVQVGYRAGQRLPEGDTARWAPVVLLTPAAVVFCVAADWTWWTSLVTPARR